MYKCLLNLYNQVHPAVMKDIVTKKRITKAIFSLKKNPLLHIRPQGDGIFKYLVGTH